MPFRQHFVSLDAIIISLPIAACSGRFELGGIRQDLETAQLKDATQLGAALIITGAKDADALLDESVLPNMPDSTLGDVDGDGRVDWLTHGGIDRDSEIELFYGGSRPARGAVFEPDSVSALPGPRLRERRLSRLMPAMLGDIDGDGRRDFGLSNSLQSSVIEAEEAAMVSWSEHVALIKYGERAQPANALLDNAIELSNPEPDPFPEELLAALSPEVSSNHTRTQDLRFNGLGDIDGDGMDDFALHVTNRIYPETDLTLASTSSVTYLVYGTKQRIRSGSAAFQSAARFDGVSFMQPVGDVDSDGHADFVAAATSDEVSYRLYLVAGSSRRHRSAVDIGAFTAIDDAHTPYQAQPLGDLDGDGHGDFAITTTVVLDDVWMEELGIHYTGTVETSYVFYGGPDLWQRPLSTRYADAAFSGASYRGVHMRPLGDWNGDGIDDLLISRGHARIVLGSGQRLNGRYGGPPEREESRVSLARAVGDIDGDGFTDLTFQVQNDDAPPLERYDGYIKYGGPRSFIIR